MATDIIEARKLANKLKKQENIPEKQIIEGIK